MKTGSTQAVRTSRFKYADRRLLLARARLYVDRIELSGFGWRGRHRRRIPLRDVARVEWWSSVGSRVNLVVHLHEGDPVQLWVRGPGLWKYAIEERAPRLVDEEAPGVAAPLPAA